jgi:uncharacterized protein YkwD
VPSFARADVQRPRLWYGWMGSEAHCANLMSASYSQMGLTRARGTASQ